MSDAICHQILSLSIMTRDTFSDNGSVGLQRVVPALHCCGLLVLVEASRTEKEGTECALVAGFLNLMFSLDHQMPRTSENDQIALRF